MSQTAQLKSTIAGQQDHIRCLEHTIDEMKQQIASQTERNDVLEFQVLEMEENQKLQVWRVFGLTSWFWFFFDILKFFWFLSQFEVCNGFVLLSYYILFHFSSPVFQQENAKSNAQFETEKANLLKELEEVKKAHSAQIQTIASIRKELEEVRAAAPAQTSTSSESEEVKNLKEKLVKAEETNTSLNEELRCAAKELGKIRFQTQGKENDLNRERKMTEALSAWVLIM